MPSSQYPQVGITVKNGSPIKLRFINNITPHKKFIGWWDFLCQTKERVRSLLMQMRNSLSVALVQKAPA
jgi:hypothetical protein